MWRLWGKQRRAIKAAEESASVAVGEWKDRVDAQPGVWFLAPASVGEVTLGGPLDIGITRGRWVLEPTEYDTYADGDRLYVRRKQRPSTASLDSAVPL